MTNKLVSVILPTFGRPDGLKRAIESVIKQTYEYIEIIVVDDNNPETYSRIKTEKLMKTYLDNSKVKYIKHSQNKNGSAARNTGIKNSKGDYIAFLDNDDEFLKDKIKLQIQELQKCGDSYGIVYTKFIRKNKNKLLDTGIENRTGNITNEILKGTFYISAGSNILLKRSVVNKIKGFDERFLRRQDLEFLIRASMKTKIAHVDKVCLIIHKDDRSNAKALSADEYMTNLNLYLESFEEHIEKLSDYEKEQITIYQTLQQIRSYVVKGKVISALKIYNKESIQLTILFKYIFYLFKRKLFKQCYGFQF